jgi:prolyl-tRNA editing enzyme YbaK/EbsC (Cys-tRNA(Pro) deacylase)
MSLPPTSLRFVAAAEALGLSIDVQEYPDGVKTSADAATAIGCEVSAIAKSIIFMADDKPVVAILSGDTRLDTKKLDGHGCHQGSARRTR